MSVDIESATLTDLDSLSRLLQQLFALEADFHFDPAKARQGLWQLLQEERACVLVARERNTVVGMCTAQLVISTAEGGYSVWIEDVVVDKAHRGRGIGRRLLDSITCWAKARGATRLQLLADLENISALEFYRHHGWLKTQLCALRTTP